MYQFSTSQTHSISQDTIYSLAEIKIKRKPESSMKIKQKRYPSSIPVRFGGLLAERVNNVLNVVRAVEN